MRILVHLHSFNDEDSIEGALECLRQQTRPIEHILLVDNGSTDGTLDREFPSNVTVIRHERNLGTSGSVKTGLRFAKTNGYEWIWILDADSVPRPDALQKLVELHDSLNERDRLKLGLISCSQVLPSAKLVQGRCLTPSGPRPPQVDPKSRYCECDSTIWSGSLINLAVVDQIGLPRCGDAGCWEDLSLDYGDIEYTYRIKAAGFSVLTDCESMIDHPIGDSRWFTILGRPLVASNHAPSRRYLYFRNLVYFWLYVYPKRKWVSLGVWFGYRLTVTLCGILLLEKNAFEKVRACMSGILDGWRKRLGAPYVERYTQT